jgi:hypothetical protein
MKKGIIIAVVVIILVAIVAAGAFIIGPYLLRMGAPVGSVVGSGNLISETRTVDSFTSVDARFSGNLYITQSGTIDVRVEAEDNLLPLLRTYVTNGVLIIDWENIAHATKPVSVYLSMGDVEMLFISGSGNVISQTAISANTLELKIAGSGKMDLEIEVQELSTSIAGSGNTVLKGSATVHSSTISGSGSVKAFDLITEKSSIKIFGSGDCNIFVSEGLNVKLSGSGSVYYKGDQSTINTDISGSGSVKEA